MPFDPQSINNLLGNPLQFRDDDLCMYQRLRGRYDGFDDTVVSRALCLRGQRYEVGPTGKPLRIKRKDMKTIVQMWMTFILANIVPIGHVSDMNMPRCYLVYSILREDYSVNMARIISEEIHKFANLEINPRNERAKGSLGFPALITALCASHGFAWARF